MLHFFNRTALKLLEQKGFQKKKFLQLDSPVYYLESARPDSKKAKETPTLLILPGYGDTVFSWTHLMMRYSKSFRVYALDFPGNTGFSPAPRPGEPLQFEDQERAAEYFLTEIVEKADYIIGNSLGGWLGIRLAAKFPERVGHMIALNPAGLTADENELRELRKQYEIEGYSDFLKLMRLMWHRIPAYFYPFSLMGYYQYVKQPEFGGLIDTVREEHFVDESLKKVKVPVSIVWGTSDKLFGGRDLGKVMKEIAPRIDYLPVHKAGHMPQLERPFEVFKILDALFAKRTEKR